MNAYNFRIGQTVYHMKIYDGAEPLKVVGIRATELELEGDYSGGTHNVCQKDWLPIEGVVIPPSPNELHIEREQLRAISFGSWLMANRNSDEYSYDDFENISQIVQDYEEYLNWCDREKKAHLPR